jgi:AcrR family transcriptional regulator
LSRVETQAQTRQRLLDAGEAAFAVEGFGGASLDRIAEAAGLTRGAVYSNFSDKADLFVAVLDRRLEQRSAEIAETMSALDSPDAFVAALRAGAPGTARSEPGVQQWVLLQDEFRLFALRHPPAAERLARHERAVRDYYVQAITHLLGQLGVEAPADPRLLAAIIYALDGSLYRQHCIDPGDIAPTAFADAIELLLRSAVALDHQPPQRRPGRPRRS